MPFVDVRATLHQMPKYQAAAVRDQNRPVLVLLGEEDPIVKGVDVSVYRDIFGTNVTAEIRKGRHCFFIQDDEAVHKRLLDWLEDNIHTSGIVKGFVGYQGPANIGGTHRGCYDASGMPPDHDEHD